MDERRYQTGMKGAPSSDAGLVITDDNRVDVVLEDGSRKHLDYTLDQNPIILSASFAGAAQNDDARTAILLAPYEGYITAVNYMVADDIVVGAGESRTWTVETTDGVVLYELTLDEDTGGALAGDTLVFTLVDEDGGAITPLMPIFFASSAGSGVGPADPGGVVALSCLDPPIPEDILSNFSVPEQGGVGDVPKPSISGFSPDRGKPGVSVDVYGANFSGAQVCRFGNYGAVFGVVDDGHIIAKVPDLMVGPGAQAPVYIEVIGPTNLVGVSKNQFTVLAGDGGGGGGTGDLFQATLSGVGLALGPESGGISVPIAAGLVATFAVAVSKVGLSSKITQGDIVGGRRDFDFSSQGAGVHFASSSWNGEGAARIPGFAEKWIWEHELKWTYKGGKFSKVFKGTISLGAAVVAYEDVPEWARKEDKKIGYRFWIVPPRIVNGEMFTQSILQVIPKSGAFIVEAAFDLALRYGPGHTNQVGPCYTTFGPGTEHSLRATKPARKHFGLPEVAQWVARSTGTAKIKDGKGETHNVSLDVGKGTQETKFIPAHRSVFGSNPGGWEPADTPGVCAPG